jgi:hypothetical protein
MGTLVAAILPSSPRKRRRLLRIALALVALAAAAGAFLLLPDAPKPPPERFSDEPAQLYDPSQVKTTVSTADRRAIDRTLERFVEDAMGRGDLASAYRLSSPALRNGLTLAQWRRGEIPVYPYTARPGSSRGWELRFREDDLAALEVFLYPGKGESTGPITLAVDMRKLGGRWLVEGATPTAVFSKPGEKARVVANTDFTRGDVSRPEAKLDPRWLLAIPGAIFAMLLGVVLVVVLRRGRTGLG